MVYEWVCVILYEVVPLSTIIIECAELPLNREHQNTNCTPFSKHSTLPKLHIWKPVASGCIKLHPNFHHQFLLLMCYRWRTFGKKVYSESDKEGEKRFITDSTGGNWQWIRHATVYQPVNRDPIKHPGSKETQRRLPYPTFFFATLSVTIHIFFLFSKTDFPARFAHARYSGGKIAQGKLNSPPRRVDCSESVNKWIVASALQVLREEERQTEREREWKNRSL